MKRHSERQRKSPPKTGQSAGHVITVAQQKGGTGKTTLCVHLAMAAFGAGKSVALIDLDPQASLSNWYTTRMAHLGEMEGLTFRQCAGWRAANEAAALKRDHDLVILDNPPGVEASAKTALRGAELLLMPLQLSPTDLWAARVTLDMAEKENLPLLTVCNRLPPRGRLADTVRGLLAEEKVPVAKTHLGNRVDFAASFLHGQGVTEYAPRGRAAGEMRALSQEVGRYLAKGRDTQRRGGRSAKAA